MNWDYRKVKVDGVIHLCEVYYDDDGNPNGCCDAIVLGVETDDDDDQGVDVENQLESMIKGSFSGTLRYPEDFSGASNRCYPPVVDRWGSK